jgi:hypothetical protein
MKILSFWLSWLLSLVLWSTGLVSDDKGVEIYTFADFPKDKVALHMPCEESNMFATKCMCHLRCTSKSCENAIKICDKYKDR